MSKKPIPLQESSKDQPFYSSITLAERWQKNGHKSGVLWLTGLSAAGKSTIAKATEKRIFHELKWQVSTLDGDHLRSGLCDDLNFTEHDRNENIRRAGEVANLSILSGQICIAAFISPFEKDRNKLKEKMPNMFHEIYIEATLETCQQRDPKKLYAKAKKGEIENFTGISSPYEPPTSPSLIINTTELTVDHAVDSLFEYARENFSLSNYN